MTLVSG